MIWRQHEDGINYHFDIVDHFQENSDKICSAVLYGGNPAVPMMVLRTNL
jgi:hypothetical protein